MATFPAVGATSTVVVGQAENTAVKTSTPWVITVLHERFHQLQTSQPQHHAEVEALGLARGDRSGMWMLEYNFPYQEERISKPFSALCRSLAAALEADEPDFALKLGGYLQARQAFQRLLAPDDYRYFSFQIWMEGIARYTEWRIADLAVDRHTPSAGFLALKDHTPFREVAASLLHEQTLLRLPTLQLGESERLAFYPFGAAEGLLLDRAAPGWQRRYFAEKFFVERYFGAETKEPAVRPQIAAD